MCVGQNCGTIKQHTMLLQNNKSAGYGPVQCAVPSVPSNAYETLTNRPTCDRQFQGEKRRRGSDREKEVRSSPLSYATPNSKTSDLKTAELLTSYCLLPYFFSEKLSASPTKKSIVGMHSTADLWWIQCYINYIALNAPNQNNPPEHPFVGPNHEGSVRILKSDSADVVESTFGVPRWANKQMEEGRKKE